MRELPKFVIERLKVATPSTGHPDADVLTAFAERSLPPREREIVSEHLARCGHCRDVIALALPAQETIEPAGSSVGLRSRWRWPVLRAAAVAAAGVVVAAVGIYQYQHRAPAKVIIGRSVENKPAAAPPVPIDTASAAPPSEKVGPSAGPRQQAVPSRSALVAGQPRSTTAEELNLRAKATGAVEGVGGGIRSGAGPAQGTKMAMAEPPRELGFAASPQASQAMKQMPAPAPAARATPPSASEVVEVQGQAEAVAVQAQTQPMNTQNAELEANADSADKVRKAKPPAIASGAAPADLPVVARNQLDLQQLQQTPMAHWTISSTGSLQRSLDGGKTWQDVNVIAKPYAYGNAMLVTSVPERSQAKAAANDAETGKKLAKSKTTSAAVFRAVAAIGNEVWAGTSGGLLYHSVDAGTVWTSIIPSAQGVTLSGEIIHIEFSDTLHGKVTTSTSEAWSTTDGGQSWQKE